MNSTVPRYRARSAKETSSQLLSTKARLNSGTGTDRSDAVRLCYQAWLSDMGAQIYHSEVSSKLSSSSNSGSGLPSSCNSH